uniref:Uncharacterized protein n=1 Tax=Leersia perrieri TaxID=77586 RepID=A0A0D9WWY7_9ORYZ
MIYRVLAGVIHTVPPLGEILHLEEGEIDEQTEMVHKFLAHLTASVTSHGTGKPLISLLAFSPESCNEHVERSRV